MVNTPMAEGVKDRAAKGGKIETPNQSVSQSISQSIINIFNVA